MTIIQRVTGFVASLSFSGLALAWGATGHMAVGSIADRMIGGTHAAWQVRNILGSNLRAASVWADCAKGVSETTLQYGAHGVFPECAVYENDASKARMVAFVTRNLDNCNRPPGAERCHKQYHYTDVAIQRERYAKGVVGTSDHDIVSAVSASIAVLQGGNPPAPFRIVGKREALRLLSHYVGDIHQPLHVAAVYLDAGGNLVDPDQGQFDPTTETRGGNDILHAGRKLHGAWDDASDALDADNLPPGALDAARAVPITAGPLSGWSTAWATESLIEGKAAYKDLRYSGEDAQHRYVATVAPGYDSLKSDIQRRQLIRAGARLAQILMAIWP